MMPGFQPCSEQGSYQHFSAGSMMEKGTWFDSVALASRVL